MAYQNAWTFSFNNPLLDSVNYYASSLVQFKNLLGTAGWSVAQSYNGVALGSTDTWGSPASLTGLFWTVLKSPEGIVAGKAGNYLGDQSRLWIVLGSNSLNNTSFMELSFHISPPTGGSATAYPSSQYPVRGYNGSTTISLAGQSYFFSSGRPGYLHFAYTAKGNFYLATTFEGSRGVTGLTAALPVAPRTIASLGVPYPYAVAIVNCVASTDNIVPSTLGGAVGWAYDGTSGLVGWGVPYVNGGWIGSTLPASGGVLDGEQEMSEIVLYLTNPGRAARIGVIQDVYASGQSTQSNLADFPIPTMVKMGNLWLPANALMIM